MQPLRRFALRSIRTDIALCRRPVTQQPVPCLRFARATPQIRLQSSEAFPNAAPRALPHKPAPHRNPDEPVYQLTFTCKVCTERSSHTVSKQGYHKGTVLINCPGCKNRHLISDHLKIFSDTSVTVEDIMKKQGEGVQRGTISPDGDVEFWDANAKASGEK